MPDTTGDELRAVLDEKWNDFNLLRSLYLERAQLYGTIINMMLDRGIWEDEFGLEDLNYAHKYILSFRPDEEEKKMKIILERRTDVE